MNKVCRTEHLVRPKVLAINGGDGTVQAVLTEIHNGAHFGDEPPPVAVLPSGKTNLIALDLGARGDPIEALERLIEVAQADLAPYTVARELIALRHSDNGDWPVIGMFLGERGYRPAESAILAELHSAPLTEAHTFGWAAMRLACASRHCLRLRRRCTP